MLGVLPGIVGTLQASETIKLIVGIGEPLIGRLLLVDAMGASFRQLKLKKDPLMVIRKRLSLSPLQKVLVVGTRMLRPHFV